MAPYPRIDDTLWERCVAGDCAALESLDHHCRRMAHRVAGRRSLQWDDAEDLGARLYVYLTENDRARLRGYPRLDYFRSWLHWRVQSLLSHGARRSDLHPESCIDDATAPGDGEAETAEAGALRHMAEDARRELLERAMRELSPRDRLAFYLHAVEGVKHADIARALGVSEAAIRKRYERARPKLQRWLGEHGFDRTE